MSPLKSSPLDASPWFHSQHQNTHASSPNGQPIQAETATPNPDLQDTCKIPVEETLEERIERLGRERPPTFKSRWHEIGLIFSIAMSQFLTEFFVSGFVVILPTLIKELDIPQALSVWPATAFSFVIASTLLVFGRLGDMWGAYPVFMAGMAFSCLGHSTALVRARTSDLPSTALQRCLVSLVESSLQALSVSSFDGGSTSGLEGFSQP